MMRILFALCLLSTPVSATASTTEQSPRFLVHLLDYLAHDYDGAVENGKIKNPAEYREQEEFVTEAQRLGSSLSSMRKLPQVQSGLSHLHQLIDSKAPATEVTETARKIQEEVLRASKIELTPSKEPKISNGRKLFAANCIACHGATGKGDGPAAAGLDPKPANLLDPKRMEGLTPFQIFNSIRLGVPGTAMAAQEKLRDEEVWDLAYYVAQMRHPNSAAKESDHERPLDLARAGIRSAVDQYRNGDFDSARQSALAAYLEGVEPVEAQLREINGVLTRDVEEKMGAVRAGIEHRASREDIEAAAQTALGTLDKAEQTLEQNRSSGWIAFFMAAGILLREGFEAVLVVIAFLSIVKASQARRAERWIHAGWVAALACGVVAWFFSGWLLGMSGASRELLEGWTSLFAVAVLLYFGLWLHGNTEIEKWKVFIQTRTREALKGKSLAGLASISFIAVFREVFETVLFLRAAWLESGPGAKTALLAGVITALAAVLAIGFILIRFSARIPVRRVFTISSALMVSLAIVLAGKAAHSLQESGILTSTTLQFFPRVELMGFFPTLQTLLAQGTVATISALLWTRSRKHAAP